MPSSFLLPAPRTSPRAPAGHRPSQPYLYFSYSEASRITSALQATEGVKIADMCGNEALLQATSAH